MSDNVLLPASGQTIATDNIGGVQYQRIKLTLGANGAADGDVSASSPMPVSGPLTASQLTAAALATDAVAQAIRDRLPSAFLTPGLLSVDTLGTPGVARQLAAGAASVNTALTTTCRRVSMHARGADIRYAIGTGAQTASGTSHYIAAGERLDLDVPASAQIAVIRAGSTDGTLELTELT